MMILDSHQKKIEQKTTLINHTRMSNHHDLVRNATMIGSGVLLGAMLTKGMMMTTTTTTERGKNHRRTQHRTTCPLRIPPALPQEFPSTRSCLTVYKPAIGYLLERIGWTWTITTKSWWRIRSITNSWHTPCVYGKKPDL